MPSPSQFLFVTCQVGAEAAVKNELKRDWPEFRFAYSRPGFLTFKLPSSPPLGDDFDLRSVFARAWGFSIGKVIGASILERAQKVVELIGERSFAHLHVWQRDAVQVGHHGFEPEPNEAVMAVEQAITASLADKPSVMARNPLRRGDLVLDCILVEPEEWWIGSHRIAAVPSRWPGGIFTVDAPTDMVSRAYVKMREALAWSRLPIKRADTMAEIGSAPGGASQALLERGLKVIGIDPAAMDERVLAHPKFTHVQKRGHEVRRREFRGVRWLAADINVAPDYTLDTVEGIVTHPSAKVEGLLLTFKLLEWNLAEQIPAYLERVHSWGYRHVAARQLSHNRQEICVAALRQADVNLRKRRQ